MVALNRAVAVAEIDGPGGRARDRRRASPAAGAATTCCTPSARTCCAASVGTTRHEPPSTRRSPAPTDDRTSARCWADSASGGGPAGQDGRHDRRDPAPELRVGDRERRATDDRLRAALDDGVLTLVEYDERTQQCWAARTQRDLDVLVVDLPAVGLPRPPRPRGPRRRVRRGLGARPPWRERPRPGELVIPRRAGRGRASVGVNVLGADDGGSVFGSRTVTVAAGQDQVQVASLFGSTEVVVPDGRHGAHHRHDDVRQHRVRAGLRAPARRADARARSSSTPTAASGRSRSSRRAEAARGGLDRDGDRDRDDD